MPAISPAASPTGYERGTGASTPPVEAAAGEEEEEEEEEEDAQAQSLYRASNGMRSAAGVLFDASQASNASAMYAPTTCIGPCGGGSELKWSRAAENLKRENG